jgi:hypothetical protein
MDKCPPEICTKIFSEACLDSGYTGRSLSLVSKFIHNTSQSVKFQSICLRGLDQTAAFASLLKKTPQHFRCVRYLFVSSCEPHQPQPVEIPPTQLQTLAEGNSTHLTNNTRAPSTPEQKKQLSMVAMRAYRRRRAARDKHRREMIVAVRSILTDVGESLEVLETAISYLTVSPTDPMRQILLPRLTELTIHDGFQINWINKSPILIICQQLRRLHIGDIRTGDPFGCVGKLAPFLTHLRISGVRQGHWFGPSLKGALGIGEETLGQSCSSFSRLPSTVQKVLVKPARPLGNGAYFGILGGSYDAMLNDLRYLNETEDSVILLDAKEQWTPLQCIREEDDWLDRVGGGEGCWNLKDKAPPGFREQEF